VREPPWRDRLDRYYPSSPLTTSGTQITYLRLLDAEAEGADWKEVARIVLRIDPAREPRRVRRAWETHLARARWMTEHGWEHLLKAGRPTEVSFSPAE
jgi:hypothetical protein